MKPREQNNTLVCHTVQPPTFSPCCSLWSLLTTLSGSNAMSVSRMTRCRDLRVWVSGPYILDSDWETGQDMTADNHDRNYQSPECAGASKAEFHLSSAITGLRRRFQDP